MRVSTFYPEQLESCKSLKDIQNVLFIYIFLGFIFLLLCIHEGNKFKNVHFSVLIKLSGAAFDFINEINILYTKLIVGSQSIKHLKN